MTPAVRSSPRRASASSAMRLGARWPQDAGRLRGMSLPPNGDEGDEGSARARRPAPCDRARGIRGAIGVETAAHAAVAMARVIAFKPAVGCGGRGRDGQFGLRIPKDSTGGVWAPTVWRPGRPGARPARDAYRRPSRRHTCTAGVESPGRRSKPACPPGRVHPGACQSAWESAAGRKNEHRPTAGRDHARAERRRRRVTRIRGRDVHSPRGYVRTFLARLGRTGVRLACAAAVKHRLSRLSISPSSQDIF